MNLYYNTEYKDRISSRLFHLAKIVDAFQSSFRLSDGQLQGTLLKLGALVSTVMHALFLLFLIFIRSNDALIWVTLWGLINSALVYGLSRAARYSTARLLTIFSLTGWAVLVTAYDPDAIAAGSVIIFVIGILMRNRLSIVLMACLILGISIVALAGGAWLTTVLKWDFFLVTVMLLAFIVNRMIQQSEELRQQAEMRLRQTEQRYRGLFDQTHDAVFIMDLNGNHLEVNQQASQLLGYSREELLRLTYHDISTEFSNSDAVWQQLLQGSLVPVYRQRLRRHDGTAILVEINIERVDYEGQPRHIQSVVRDISQQESAFAALQQSEVRMKAILDALPDLIFRVRQDGTYLDYHVANVSDLIVPPHEFMGKTINETLPANLAALQMQHIEEVIHTGKEAIYEYGLDNEKGSVSFEARMVRCALDEAIVIIRNTTERKRTEAALIDSEARYRHIIETAQEGIWLLDSDGITTYVNQRMAEILGYTTEEMIGKHLFDFADVEGRTEAAHKLERRREGIAEHHEFRFVHKNGSDVWTIISTNPLKDKDGRFIGALGMVTDITERKYIEQELIASEVRHRALVNAIPDLMFCLLADGTFVDYHAPRLERLFIPPEEFIGRKAQEVFPYPNVPIMDYIDQVLREQREISFEYTLKSDQKPEHFEARMVPYSPGEVLVIVRVARYSAVLIIDKGVRNS